MVILTDCPLFGRSCPGRISWPTSRPINVWRSLDYTEIRAAPIFAHHRSEPGLTRCTPLPLRCFSHVLLLTLSRHRAPPPVSPCHYLSKGGQASHSWLLWHHSLRRSRGVRGSADHQHGTRSLADHVFCHTAQKHVGESRPPMRPHDNQIHPLLTRHVYNRLAGGPPDEEAVPLEPSTLDPLQTCLQEALRIGLLRFQ